jgi:hypothetical protein
LNKTNLSDVISAILKKNAEFASEKFFNPHPHKLENIKTKKEFRRTLP